MPNEGKSKKDSRRRERNKLGEDQDAEDEFDLADIMAELKTQRRDIVSRLENIESRLEDVITEATAMKSAIVQANEALNDQRQRLTTAEQRVSDLEDTLQTTNRELSRALRLIETLEFKTDDLENRGRRKNLLLLGLPENAESGHIFEFIQQKISEWLNIPKHQSLEFERIHRVGQKQLSPELNKIKKAPRPVMIRFLRFRDCDMVFRAAKNKTISMKEGEAVLTFRHDLSAEVRRRRREFSEMIDHLREKDMFRGFAYPHRLRVLHKGKIEIFDSPPEVKTFIDNLSSKPSDIDQDSGDGKSPE